MSPSFRRPHRRAAGSLVAVIVFAAASAPSLAARLDPEEPLVARATASAHRVDPAVSAEATASPSESEALAAEVVRLTNIERAAAGLPALVVHPAVTLAATTHSEDQAASGRMSHIGSDGSDAGIRLTRAGFTWRNWAENVAAGQRSAQDVVQAWMGSAGHRANILSASFTTIGVGVADDARGTRYWTMDLAA